jgi:predicted small secreted protein
VLAVMIMVYLNAVVAGDSAGCGTGSGVGKDLVILATKLFDLMILHY